MRVFQFSRTFHCSSSNSSSLKISQNFARLVGQWAWQSVGEFYCVCGTVLTMTKVPPRSVGSPLEQGDGREQTLIMGCLLHFLNCNWNLVWHWLWLWLALSSSGFGFWVTASAAALAVTLPADIKVLPSFAYRTKSYVIILQLPHTHTLAHNGSLANPFSAVSHRKSHWIKKQKCFSCNSRSQSASLSLLSLSFTVKNGKINLKFCCINLHRIFRATLRDATGPQLDHR